ncbi:MAG: MaoC family dehydratase N-terminal domain-containing protein [Chloroflexi bacterium]|nr:MaoC family dehydratase N-terminal domain-containing protein [Chloroflexota bacterium]
MTSPQLEFNRELLGKEFPSGTFHVEKEQILAYCQAVGETSPIYTDDEAARRAGYRSLVAPPGFSNLLVRATGRPNIGLKFSATTMHASQAVESFLPIQASDTLEARTRLKDVYAKTGRTGTMVFIVWETLFTNQEGKTVAAVSSSFVHRPRHPGT